MGFSASDEYSQVLAWCKDNEEAADFLIKAFEITQIADDFVDQDVVRTRVDETRMLRLLHLCMVELPTNPFYREYQAWFLPLMSTSFTIWSCTDKWGADDSETTQQFGYVYREICEQMITMAAQIIGGLSWAREVTLDVHKFYHQKDQESFEEWRNE